MSFGTITLRPSRDSEEWVQARIVQVMFSPTYLGQLEGLPTKEQLEARLQRFAGKLWGDRGNLQVLMGSGKQRFPDLTPEAIEEMEKADLGYLKFPPTAAFVELEGPLIEPRTDPYDLSGSAWLVMLGPRVDLSVGLDRVIQRLVDGYELVWDEIAINTAP